MRKKTITEEKDVEYRSFITISIRKGIILLFHE